MLNWLLKGFLATAALRLLENYRHLSVHLLRLEAAKSYLHGVRMARLSAMGVLCIGLLVGLVCFGAVLFHVGLFMLLPWSVKAKAALSLILGATYVAAGFLALRMLMDEERWIEKSGAAAMLDEAKATTARG